MNFTMGIIVKLKAEGALFLKEACKNFFLKNMKILIFTILLVTHVMC